MEPDAIRSIFLPDIVGELLEELAAVGAAGAELMDGLDELMDGLDEDFMSSLAQPAVSRDMNAIIPAILAVPNLIGYSSSVLKMDDGLGAKSS
jgi:hypothetical protein